LSAWYVATTTAILLALGGALFFAVAHQIDAQLDASLDGALSELIRAESASMGSSADAISRGVLSLRAVGMDLSLLDSTGTPLYPGSVSPAVRAAAVEAAARGQSALERPSQPEHVMRIRARAFRSRTGVLRVAVATADLEDLEDSYTLLIWQFAIAALIAVGLAALGGMWLARQSSAPIEAAVEHMQQFMADAAHELRTPVSILRTEAETAMDREREGESDQRTFAVIAHETRRLSTVVDDLFTLARAESGERPIEREPVVLDDLVSDAVVAAAARAGKKGIALELTEFEEARVIGSAALLSRLVGILLDNALKYTAPDGRVTVGVGATATSVRLRFADTGIGIPVEAMPRVYDRFFRSDGARTMAGGAGLGLAIAKWITEVHGGTIHIDSVVGSGTTVIVEIPSSG
jgi:signal transduction histidine kinase